jgi:hypothetical protein
MQHSAARENGAIRRVDRWQLRPTGSLQPLYWVGMLLALWSAAGAHAHEQCEPALMQSIRTVQDSVDALHRPKSDAVSLEFRLIGEACARGRDLEAAWRLEQLQAQLIAVRNAARARSGCQATSSAGFLCTVSADADAGRRTMNVDPTPSRLSAITSP